MENRGKLRGLLAATALSTALAGAAPNRAQALSMTVDHRVEHGPGRVVEMDGHYRRTSQTEHLEHVRLILMDASHRVMSTSRGTFDRPSKSWQVGGGDYRTVYYRVDFIVSTPNGDQTFSTATYSW